MRILHFAMSVRGALNHPSQLKNCITVDGKKLKTTYEVREFLLDQLSMGHELLPMGDCEGFDYKTGCPGHQIEEVKRGGEEVESP